MVSPHDEKDIRRAVQGSAENDEALSLKPIHEIGMLPPLWLDWSGEAAGETACATESVIDRQPNLTG